MPNLTSKRQPDPRNPDKPYVLYHKTKDMIFPSHVARFPTLSVLNRYAAAEFPDETLHSLPGGPSKL